MKTGYKVGDCMTINPISVSKHTSLCECAKIMRDKHVGSVLVMDHDELIGLVTEQDLVRKGMAQKLDLDASHVKDVMITDLVSVEPGKDLFDALRIMRDYNIRHLPVMNEGKMLGFLTSKDILKIQPQLFEILADKIELREASRKPILFDGEEGICDECNNLSARLEDIDGRRLCPGCRVFE